jgi:hypothetical protein
MLARMPITSAIKTACNTDNVGTLKRIRIMTSEKIAAITYEIAA